MVDLIRKILDVFYPLVSRIFDKTTYYYAACGTGNLVFKLVAVFSVFSICISEKDILCKPH